MKRKRVIKFKKTRVDFHTIDESHGTFTEISDSSLILFSSEACKKYDLELLGVYQNSDWRPQWHSNIGLWRKRWFYGFCN